MLFFLDIRVEYPATMSQKDLSQIWTQAADAATAARQAGAVVDLWKCIGQHRVVAIVNIASADRLDQILRDLPVLKEPDRHVRIDVVPLRPYNNFTAELTPGPEGARRGGRHSHGSRA